MSSILDALRKIEAAEPPGIHKLPEPRDPTVTTRRTIVALVLAFVTGAGLAIWFGRGEPPPVAEAPAPEGKPVAAKPAAAAKDAKPPVRAESPKPVAPPAAPPPPPAAAAPPAPTPAPPVAAGAAVAPEPVAVSVAAPPAALVEPAAPPVAAASLPIAPPAAAPVADEPPRGRIAPGGSAPVAPRNASPAPTPLARASVPRSEPPPRPRAAAPRPRIAPPPAGAPQVQVSFLLYSFVPSRRTVTVSIDGGGLVTLKEGDVESGIQVSRILPDRVELVYEGQSFVVLTRD